MNIYLVTRTDSVFYDEFDSAVVVASSPKEAISIRPKGSGHHKWDKENLEVKYVGISSENEPKIILASFVAG